MNSKKFTTKAITTAMLGVAILAHSCSKQIDQLIGPEHSGEKQVADAPLAIQAAASYSIPMGNIADHADASISGSIAWYFATYGGGTAAAPHTFYLTSSSTYNTKKAITMPEHARLTEASGVNAAIQCDPLNWNNAHDRLFVMKEGSYMLHVELRLNWKVKLGILISSADNVKVINVTVHGSKKVSGSTLIYATESSNLEIRDCLLRRAGCEATETNFARTGYLIHLIRGSHIDILNNDMAVSPSSGIGFVQSTFVNIDGNTINDTGRAMQPEYISDGITSYHGGQGSLNRVIFIRNNTIMTSRNHGIHVSGYGISITGNHITGSTHANIYIGDQRSPQDCSADVWITGNHFGQQGTTYSIWRKPVIASRIYISNNTGSTSLQPLIACN